MFTIIADLPIGGGGTVRFYSHPISTAEDADANVAALERENPDGQFHWVEGEATG